MHRVQQGFSLPMDVVDALDRYAKDNDIKKTDIVAQALRDYITKQERKNEPDVVD